MEDTVEPPYMAPASMPMERAVMAENIHTMPTLESR